MHLILLQAPTCVDVGERRPSGGVPEADAAVGSPPAAGQQAVLVGGPGDGLDRRGVVAELEAGRRRVQVPDVELVVVAPEATSRSSGDHRSPHTCHMDKLLFQGTIHDACMLHAPLPEAAGHTWALSYYESLLLCTMQACALV